MGVKGLGLLTHLRLLLEDIVELEARAPGERRIPPGAPDPTDFSGLDRKKRWQEPCFFSCIPWNFSAVDKYDSSGTSLAAGAPWTEIIRFNVPEGKVFRLDRTGYGYSAGGSAYLHYQTLIDGDPVGLGFGDQDYVAGALNIRDMFPHGNCVVGPATVAINAKNTSGSTAYTAFARLVGYLGPDE